ncbi:MAG: hypothetical protein EB023_04615 [Flavobacteriia bacterium]|nr:hypothetical protein [Flavobacteriia bacterium]
MNKFLLGLSFILILCFSCTKKDQDPVSDIDGNSYKAVGIGKQIWMAEDLKVTKFRNGDSIPRIQSVIDWEIAYQSYQPACCYFDNDPSKGMLYNWYALNDPRGLAPEGWHVPTDDEWRTLEKKLKEDQGTKMKNTSGWNNSGNGDNSSGFAGLPRGYRYNEGYYYKFGEEGFYWTSTESGSLNAWNRSLKFDSPQLLRGNYNKNGGFSIRCMKDDE